METNPATAITCLPLFGADECDAILARLDAAPWRDARIALPSTGAGVESEIRRCELLELPDRAAIERLEAWLLGLNRALFGFDLTGFSTNDPVAAMRYSEGSHFAWHLDNATTETMTRKLSFTLQLTDPADYDNGDLEFAMYADAPGGNENFAGYRMQIRQRGAVTVFPAFHLHRVTPVTRGVRTAVVGWVHGPPFR